MRHYVIRAILIVLWVLLMIWVMSGCRGGTLVLSTNIHGVDVAYTVEQ
jgi:hypothetical protein